MAFKAYDAVPKQKTLSETCKITDVKEVGYGVNPITSDNNIVVVNEDNKSIIVRLSEANMQRIANGYHLHIGGDEVL